MKNSKIFKKILSTSLASLTALSTLSGSISTKIYAQDPEVQANSTKSEGRYGLGFSYQGHNFFVTFNESNQEVAEKFKNTLHKVMEEELGQYSTKIEEKEKAIFLDVQEPSFMEWIKNICSLEKPAEQKATIEYMFNLIVESYLKNTKLVANDSAKETQTEAPAEEAAKVEPIVESSTEETQTEAPAEGTPLIEIESSAEETKEESTAPAKEKKSLLNKILNFLKKLPLIGKLFKFLFK